MTSAGRTGGVTLEQDEGIRPGTTAERLGRLPAAFSPDGTITAGTASQLSDGGCAVVVMDKDRGGGQGDALILRVPAPAVLRIPPGTDSASHARRDGG